MSACRSPTCAAGFDKVEFAYDGEGHRTQLKTTSSAGATSTTDFRYQGDAIVEERLTDAAHPTGAVVRSYVVDAAGAVVKLVVPAGEPDAGTYLVTWNGHGDALNLDRLNADGTVTLANSFSYSSWGAPTTATHNGIGNLAFRFLYVGRSDVQWDDSFGLGLSYMHARHYSPALGRFLQPDPDGLEDNQYAYAQNNLLMRTDSSGTCTQGLLLSIFGGPEVGLGVTAACVAVVAIFGFFAVRTTIMSYQLTHGDRWWLDKRSPPPAPEIWLQTRNKQTRTVIDGLRKQIDEHERKLQHDPASWDAPHWRHEIQNWERQIEALQRRLPGRRR